MVTMFLLLMSLVSEPSAPVCEAIRPDAVETAYAYCVELRWGAELPGSARSAQEAHEICAKAVR